MNNQPIDIHKIIDDAMEKKDRYVTLYIGESGMSVNVYPVEENGTWWIDETDRDSRSPLKLLVRYRCTNCGNLSSNPHTFCPHCGEQTKGVKRLEEVQK